MCLLADAHTLADAVDFTGLAAEIATEVWLPHDACAELTTHAAQRETCYGAADPAALARQEPQP